MQLRLYSVQVNKKIFWRNINEKITISFGRFGKFRRRSTRAVIRYDLRSFGYGSTKRKSMAEPTVRAQLTALDSGEQSGSRLGFKGSEDLGSGLKAIFNVEMGILADTGSSQGGLTFGRQAWVGLAGDFGTVKMGRQYTPQFYFFDAVDPFDLGFTSGHAGASTSTGGVFGFLSNSSWRVNNSVSYQSNNMSGFSMMGLYGLGEVAGNNSGNRPVGMSAVTQQVQSLRCLLQGN